MATITKSAFLALFLVALVSQGHSRCIQSDLQINQTKTGKLVEDKPEWNVTVTNPCDCVFASTTLACQGFQTVETIDPFVLSKSGDECLLNNGNAIAPHTVFSFTYAWDDSFPFAVKEAEVACD